MSAKIPLRTLPAAFCGLTQPTISSSSRAWPRAASVARNYHSPSHPDPSPYNTTETLILRKAHAHIPTSGFSNSSLRLGAREAGYTDAATTSLFPRGPVELAFFHLIQERRNLADRARSSGLIEDGGVPASETKERVRLLILERLTANREINHQWSEALAHLTHPRHLPSSLRELALLSDEILFLAGSTALDTTYYTRRAAISALYASAEMYMTQDSSAGFVDTERFVGERLGEMHSLGQAAGDAGEWAQYQAMSVVNSLRSLGVPI